MSQLHSAATWNGGGTVEAASLVFLALDFQTYTINSGL
jgi:hypothetical protein